MADVLARSMAEASEPDQPPPEVFAAVEAGDGVGRGAQAVEKFLAVAQPPLAHPRAELPHRLLVALDEVEDDEALHARALHQEMALDARALRRRVPVRDRCGAAD